MESSKQQTQFRIHHYTVKLMAFSEKKLKLNVSDQLDRVQYENPEVILQSIGVSTLIQAFQQNKLQIKLGFKVNKTQENTFLEIDVLISSQFLKPVEENIFLKKKRDIPESQILTNAVEFLGEKMKQVKEKNGLSPNSIYCNRPDINQQSYSAGLNYEPIASIKLPKGKYLISVTFLLKATNQLAYIFFNQTYFMVNQGFYVPSNTCFIPHTLKKVHNVTKEEEVININTHYGNSYPAIFKNVVVTAKAIQ